MSNDHLSEWPNGLAKSDMGQWCRRGYPARGPENLKDEQAALEMVTTISEKLAGKIPANA
jgi:hypothetical protein